MDTECELDCLHFFIETNYSDINYKKIGLHGEKNYC